MEQLKEDYVSLETARLLQKKGCFNEFFKEGINNVCKTRYVTGIENSIQYYITKDILQDYETIDDFIPAPTVQMAMKYLRQVYHVFIQIELYSKYDNYCFKVFQNTHRLMIEHREVYNTYEEAAEAALKYCLTNVI